MVIEVRYLLHDCYMPCVLTYFRADIFDMYPFLKNVYDTPNHRNANVKAIYMFSERQNFKTADAESFFLKNGLVLLPLFLPVNHVRYADDRAVSDIMLTIYSPMLVGIWNRARDHIRDRSAEDVGTASTSSSQQQLQSPPPPPPIEIYVQRDCSALREIRDRINSRLLNMTHYCGENQQRVFTYMTDAAAESVERTGKSTVSKNW